MKFCLWPSEDLINIKGEFWADNTDWIYANVNFYWIYVKQKSLKKKESL